MSTLTATPAARAALVAAYRSAMDRANRDRLVCYRARTSAGQIIPDTYTVPSADGSAAYTVRHLGGTDWANLACDCPAGSHSRICKHMATTAYCRAHRCYAAPKRCAACDPTFCPGDCPDTAEMPERVRECLLCGKNIGWSGPCLDCYEIPDTAPAAEPIFGDAVDSRCEHGVPSGAFCQDCHALDYELIAPLPSGETVAVGCAASAEVAAFESAVADSPRRLLADPVHERQIALTQRMRDAGSIYDPEHRRRDLIDGCLGILTGAHRPIPTSDPLRDFFE